MKYEDGKGSVYTLDCDLNLHWNKTPQTAHLSKVFGSHYDVRVVMSELDLLTRFMLLGKMIWSSPADGAAVLWYQMRMALGPIMVAAFCVLFILYAANAAVGLR